MVRKVTPGRYRLRQVLATTASGAFCFKEAAAHLTALGLGCCFFDLAELGFGERALVRFVLRQDHGG